jgi:hypothetical protein
MSEHEQETGALGNPEVSNNLPTEIDPVMVLSQDPGVAYSSSPGAEVETQMPEVVA